MSVTVAGQACAKEGCDVWISVQSAWVGTRVLGEAVQQSSGLVVETGVRDTTTCAVYLYEAIRLTGDCTITLGGGGIA